MYCIAAQWQGLMHNQHFTLVIRFKNIFFYKTISTVAPLLLMTLTGGSTAPLGTGPTGSIWICFDAQLTKHCAKLKLYKNQICQIK